jgi:hypothetical protein
MIAVLAADPAGKERRDQLVVLDPVIEGIDQTLEGGGSACPFEQRLCLSGLRLGDPEKLPSEVCRAAIPAAAPPL